MDNLPPIASPLGTSGAIPLDDRIVGIVNARKWALLAVFANILFVALILALRVILNLPNLLSTEPLAIFLEWVNVFRLVGILSWCVPIGVAVATWNISRALKIKLAWLLALLSLLPLVLGMPFPLIGVVILLFLNWRAMVQLKAAGYRVGVWGLKSGD